jgi:isopentenyl-diphosphate Delta-isomerase
MTLTDHLATTTARRKDDHIEINLTQPVQAIATTTGFEAFRFVHQALPDLDLAEVSVATTFLGSQLQAPILISAMTGGTPRGSQITRRLAAAAQRYGLPMGVGSQRAALEDADRAALFEVRDLAPDIFLMANLGAVQLNLGYGVEHCRRAVEMIGANALVLHLNPLQEALQPEGDTEFSGLLSKIEQVCAGLEVPVVAKEIGCGMSAEAARNLRQAGVAAIDVGGAGGTSWSGVEHFRATDAVRRRVSATFFNWGIPTATTLRLVRSAVPDLPVIASGGLRTGIDAAFSLRFGATLAGFAGPLLRAADEGEETLDDMLAALIAELRIAMFCTGARTVTDLTMVPLLDATGSLVAGTNASSGDA